MALDLASQLMAWHPARARGNLPLAVVAIEQVLAGAVEPYHLVEAIWRAHELWRPQWASRGPRGFVPMLARWVRDGDYLHPPEAEADLDYGAALTRAGELYQSRFG